MKRLIIFILFLPQLIYAQYQSKEFMLPEGRHTAYHVVGITATKDSIVSLNIGQPISGLFVSGTTILGSSQNSYARITVKDKNNSEYLVYENYLLLSDGISSRFSKVGMESVLLDDVVPVSMKIEVYDALVQIDSIYFSGAQNQEKGFKAKAKSMREEQTRHIADKLNNHLMEKGMTWQAGPTSVASKTFEEKKMMFGSKVPCLYGFDYYKGGLYVFGSREEYSRNDTRQSVRNNTFVRDFDWRNRHGKNWISSVKQQINNTCWAHATTATIESNFNIYFNNVFEDNIVNLSEQELASCLDNDGLTISDRISIGGVAMYALDYVQRKGIVRDVCFPFNGNVPCDNKCSNPVEVVSFSSFRNLWRDDRFCEGRYTYNDSIADTLRMAVIKSPVVVDYFRNQGHSVSCVGFHQINMGDTLCSNINNSYYFVVDSTTSHFVDMISWIIKNSWGDDWGEGGYAKVTFYTVRLRLYEISPPFTSLVFSEADRCVTDEDMDGYYIWGSGTKPANLPVWIPDEQDGDDENPGVGAMDEYGNCDTLTATPAVTWYIDANVNYNSTDSFTYPNIVIMQDGTLTISSSSMTMKEGSAIRVQSGGKLVIDGGQINDADITIESGGILIIDHNGLIKLRRNGLYEAQIGAKVSIIGGKIDIWQ